MIRQSNVISQCSNGDLPRNIFVVRRNIYSDSPSNRGARAGRADELTVRQRPAVRPNLSVGETMMLSATASPAVNFAAPAVVAGQPHTMVMAPSTGASAPTGVKPGSSRVAWLTGAM